MEQFAPPNRKTDVSSEWLHALLEFALDGIITMDYKGRIIAFNPAAEKIFGYHSAQVIGHTVSEKLIPGSLKKVHESGLANFLATGNEEIIGRRVEVTAMRADQSVFAAELEVISVNPGSTPVFMAYLRDISGQKYSEKERLQYAINIKKTLMQTILAVSRIVEIRDPYTAGHQRRVAHLAAAIAKALKFSEERIDGVFLGALIHDIGKIAVPSEILARPGKLLDEDINYLKIHCRKGYEILEPVNFPWPVAEIALQHHEHIDGSGYPQGLRGDEILLESRIICVADVVESLTAHRPYRPAYSLEKSLAFIRKRAGKCYGRQIVAACSELFEKGYSIDAIDMDELTWMSSLS
ncbi:MAG: PAS domain S-box protein [Desulfobacteraceae bacterium]|nr:PAS domain S-box protein [Desulfobacteraceae bacterium]MBC2757371.1 PAS domain S-box protein [Desulfobacteraceae bacterium]